MSRLTVLMAIISTLAVLATFSISRAQEPNTKTKDEQSWTGKKLEKLEEKQEEISHRVTKAARKIDSFFSDERHENEENKTRLKLSAKASGEEGRGKEANFGLDLRLVLPALERRVSLAVNSVTEDDNTPDADSPEQTGSKAPSAEKKGVNAALRYLVIDDILNNLRVDGGLRFHGITPEPFAGVRFRKTLPFNLWEIRYTQRVYWYRDTGAEANARLDFEKVFRTNDLFRLAPEGSWYEDKDGFFYGVTATYYQQINKDHSLQYESFAWLITEPNELDDIGLKTSYRHRIYKRWLFGEVSVWAKFPRDRDYRRTLGAFYKIDVYFGYTEKFTSDRSDEVTY